MKWPSRPVRLAIGVPIILFCVFQLWKFATKDPEGPYYILAVAIAWAAIYGYLRWRNRSHFSR